MIEKKEKFNFVKFDKAKKLQIQKYECESIQPKYKKILSGISILLFIISYYMYYLSFETCKEGQFSCGKKVLWIKKKLTQAITSAILLSILIELIILKLLSKLHLIHLVIFYLIMYIYSHGLEFYDHGLYNLLGCLLVIICCNILFIPFNLLLILIRYQKKLFIIIYINFLVMLSFSYYYFISTRLDCKDWQKGLNNTYIENDVMKYGCQIKFPKTCLYKIGTYFVDFSKIYKIECKGEKKGRKKLLEFSKSPFINSTTKRFGFPINTKIPMCTEAQGNKNDTLTLCIQLNLLDMENQKLLNNLGKEMRPEIIVDFSNNTKGDLIIDLNYNETLSKQRKELEKNSNPLYENVLILYFDSVSRSTGIRKLKKTMKFIEKFMPYIGGYNELYPGENFHSFQFFKFHAFLQYTHGNYPKMFYGKDKSPDMIRITKYFKEKGFVTAFSNDFCQRESCSMPHKMSNEQICDHEYINCDPNQKKINSMIKRCLYDKINLDHQLEYGYQFWRKYNNNRKFLLVLSNDGHEGTLEVIKYSDEVIYNFLNNLFNEHLLKDTIIFILSDHGCPMPSTYYFNDFFYLERSLPMLYIISYDNNNLNYELQYKNISENQQKFITPYDVYNTLGHIIFNENYGKIKFKEKVKYDTPRTSKGESLFKKINPKLTPSNFRNMSKGACIKNKKKN